MMLHTRCCDLLSIEHPKKSVSKEASMVYLVLFLCLLVGSVLAIVTLQNLTTEVQFMLFIWPTPRVPPGLLVVFASLLGALFLYIISLLSAVHQPPHGTKL